MTDKLRTHLRSNLVGYIALLVALVGVPVTWALARNSVGTVQLKTGAVRTVDIAAGAVNSAKIDDGSIRTRDFAVAPPDNAGGTETVVYARTSRTGGHEAYCRPGEQLIGGGGLFSNGRFPNYTADVPLTRGTIARNTPSATGWLSNPNWGSGGTGTWAMCARWGQPAAGPRGPTGPTGPAGSIADQTCPPNEFVRGFSGGQIVCAPVFSP